MREKKVKIYGRWYDPRDLRDELEQSGEQSSVYTYIGVIIAALGGAPWAIAALAQH